MDGDGWSRCALGHRHWGRYGAAGLLVLAPGSVVLLQHRAPWSHGGDTWGVPGGARRRTETAVEAALRETVEETALDVTQVRTTGRHVDDHGGWAYVTVLAEVDAPLPVTAERESLALRWVPVSEVAAMPLHSGFATAWPLLRLRLAS
ncbi:MAG: NUDIX hydrolase [Frankiaceae bacterium]|nr:NUDIX hydrolase [Frankiaceae bacterium]